jgi:hypothetical protein
MAYENNTPYLINNVYINIGLKKYILGSSTPPGSASQRMAAGCCTDVRIWLKVGRA